MHIIQQPTYMSKYPPAQALFLALGMVVFGHPIAGVWLSLALACAATCWMLLAWMPRRWAVFGGVLAALTLAPSPWAQGYWGGAVAMLGGALAFGALRRILRAGRWHHGLLLGLGLALLANSRPFEGLVVSLPLAAVLAVWAWRRWLPATRGQVLVALVPAALVLVLSGAWMVWFNYRVTGHPLRMPYQVHDATYAAAPLFFCQGPLDHLPTYRHRELRDYYAGWELPRFQHRRVALGLNWSFLAKLWSFCRFFIGPVFAVPLLVLAWRRPGRWTAFAALTSGLLLLAFSQTLYLNAHYAAPITCLIFFLIVQGFRHLEWWEWRGRQVGRRLVQGTVILLFAFLMLPLAVDLVARPDEVAPRTRIATQLKAKPSPHLVIVRYGPNHDCHDEWVYNGADIDGAAIVWARDMGPAQNQKLLDYFGDRRIWLVEVDAVPSRLMPYPSHGESSPTRRLW
jgi:hypothetical protein